MNLRIINPDGLSDPTPNGYSHVALATGGASLAFIAGQGGGGLSGGMSADFEGQVKQAFANLGVAIEAAGARPEQVAKLNSYVVDHDEAKLGILARHVKAMFGETPPPHTLVPVPRLAEDGMLFEIDAIAVLD